MRLIAVLAGACALALTACSSSSSLVMIRPTGVKLTSNGSTERHLSGRVTDVAFRGRGYEHAIDINGTTRLTGVFADVRAKRGEIVGLRMDPAGCHLFPVEP
jgi:iron(III) transport system ATP-binding protein